MAEKSRGAAKPAGRSSWFDEATHEPLIEKAALQLEGFVQTMADGRVDADEIKAQETRVVALMTEIEPLLDDSVHEKVTRLLCELTAYDLMRMMHTMQQARVKATFQG